MACRELSQSRGGQLGSWLGSWLGGRAAPALPGRRGPAERGPRAGARPGAGEGDRQPLLPLCARVPLAAPGLKDSIGERSNKSNF